MAQEEARLLNHNYIGTEHILLGLLHEDDNVAAVVLGRSGVTLQGARTEVEGIIGHGGSEPSGSITTSVNDPGPNREHHAPKLLSRLLGRAALLPNTLLPVAPWPEAGRRLGLRGERSPRPPARIWRIVRAAGFVADEGPRGGGATAEARPY
jgi:hypothetical protein